MKKKKKAESQTTNPAPEKPTPLPSMAQDFARMDEEDPLCAKKNDGTD